MVVGYLVLIELAKRLFFSDRKTGCPSRTHGDAASSTEWRGALPGSASAPSVPAEVKTLEPSAWDRGHAAAVRLR
jgi:hypothetical protein